MRESCQCGCGQYPKWKKSRFCSGHFEGTIERRLLNSQIHFKNRPCENGDGYKTIIRGFMQKRVLIHRLFVEKLLGKLLPAKAVVHHIDENRGLDLPNRLVVCEDDAYHQILHRRSRALRECGHAHWRKCSFCKKWDAPENLIIKKGWTAIQHRVCGNAYRAKWAREKHAVEKEVKNVLPSAASNNNRS